MLFSELASTMTSVVNISEEEMGIWNATLIKPKPIETSEIAPGDTTVTNNSATDNAASNANGTDSLVPVTAANIATETSTAANWSELSPEFIPLAVQLRPYWPERSLNGLFRLFFLDEELVAVTQYCPCVFFPEVIIECKIRIYEKLQLLIYSHENFFLDHKYYLQY